MTTTPLHPPTFRILLPAAMSTFSPPRTETEAKAYAKRMNEEAKRQRERNTAEDERRRQEAAASAAHTARLSSWRPATRATAAKRTTLNPTAIYAAYNARADALPAERAPACADACVAPDNACDAQAICRKWVEEEAASRGVLSFRAIYGRMNAAAGWAAATDRVNAARGTGAR